MSVQFICDFPGGNGRCLRIDEEPADQPVRIRFAPDPRNCSISLWFYFRLEGLNRRACRCILANPEQTLGGCDWSRSRPVYRTMQSDWQRCRPAIAIATEGDRTEWAWDLPEADTIELAFCYPYQRSDLDHTLEELGQPLHREPIGLSAKGRTITRLSNRAAAANAQAKQPDQAGCFIVARQHAGETPGAWVLDGLMRHIHSAAGDDQLSAITWWLVPLMNIDDIVEGSYGKDPDNHDCNRGYDMHWPTGTFRRAESLAVAEDLGRLVKQCDRICLVDLHAPGHAERSVYVPFTDRPAPDGSIAAPDHEQRTKWLADLLHENIPRSLRPIQAAKHWGPAASRQRGMVLSDYAIHQFGVDAMTLEISYQGTEKHDYIIDDYRQIGVALANTLTQWLTQAGS